MANDIYRRVEIGDHHEVFCNGQEHISLAGSSMGRAHPGIERDRLHIRRVACDCKSKEFTNG